MTQYLRLLFFLTLTVSFESAKAQADDCSNALEISNPADFTSLSNAYTNIGSTPSNIPISSCASFNTTYDVWFKFTAVGTNIELTIRSGSTEGTLKAPNISLYSGVCPNISQQACIQGMANATMLSKKSLNIGTTYLIRIATESANRGSFKLSIRNYTPTLEPGADCDVAAKLCYKSEVIVGALSGSGKNNNEIPGNSCFNNGTINSQESNSSWIQWTCDQPGTLTFTIAPNDTTNDLDFILYELPGTSSNACGTRSLIRCTATSCPTLKGSVGLNLTSTDADEPLNCDPNVTSDGFLKYLDMIKDKTYVLMINNFSAQTGYKINFGGTGTFKGGAGGPPVPVITASNDSVCHESNITFSGNLSTNYNSLSWSFPQGQPSVANGPGPHVIHYSNSGNYTVLLKANEATCMVSTSLNIFVLNPLIPQVLGNIPNCENEPIAPLTAKGGNGVFTWFEDVTLKDTLHVGPIYTPVTTVTDTIYLTETINGCSSGALPIIIQIVKPMPFPFSEGFEGVLFPPKAWTTSNVLNDTTVSVKHNKIVGGFGTSSSCLEFDNYNHTLVNNKDELRSSMYDFSQTKAPVLTFDVAYARRDSTHSDTLIVIVSDDCKTRGYTRVYLKGGKNLATFPNDIPQFKFVPAASQWRKEIIDMSAFAGFSRVQVTFQNISQWGQPIYIDNIQVQETAVGISDNNLLSELHISPNPFVSEVNLSFKTDDAASVTLEINNIMGQQIRKYEMKSTTGNFSRIIDFSDQPAGVYSVTIICGDRKIVKKLVKQ